MTITQSNKQILQKPLRLWPGVVIVVLQWLVRFGLPIVMPGFEGFRIAFAGGFFGAVAILVWWVFLSRAPRADRWGALFLMVFALVVTLRINHESMGLMWCLGYAIPVLNLALVAWAVGSRHLPDGLRRTTMVATILLACGMWTLVRTDGMTGDHVSKFAWRWTETPEERLLAQSTDESSALRLAPAAARPARPDPDWPGFRGPNRDGVIPGIRIETDWNQSPPIELWRRPIGPGWSSFAVRGNLLFTQEQRGDEEVVACYNATTGEPVWRHHDGTRFYESMGGAGPRATPTLSDGRVYALGATGILNALNAVDGAVVWSRNAASDIGAKVPPWGFASSPLVVDDLLIVAATGQLVAYDLVTGNPRWFGPEGGDSYSSPHLLTIDGVVQILLLSGAGATSVTPEDGTVLWEYSWKGRPMVQPALTAGGNILINAGEGHGVRCLAIANRTGGWTVEERWASIRLKPNFNDLVIHDGHAFGFDGRILACMDLEDGRRKWKGGRYGQGQLVLLPDQDLLLVVSEKGALALVEASTAKFSELARFPAIEGKTWNHPVLVGNLLLVRNSQEMVAFRLSLVGR